QRGHGFMGLDLVAVAAPSPALRKSSIEDEPRYPLRVPNGVGDGYSATLRNAKQREPVQAACVHNALQIGNHGLKRQIAGIPLGKAITALIVSNQRVLSRKRVDPMTPDWAFPFVLQMRHPVRCAKNRRACSRDRVGNLDAVWTPAIMYLLRTLDWKAFAI